MSPMLRPVRRQPDAGKPLRELCFLAAVGCLLQSVAGCTGSRPSSPAVPAHVSGASRPPVGVEDWVYPEALRNARTGDDSRQAAPKRAIVPGSGSPESPGARRRTSSPGKRPALPREVERAPVLPWVWIPPSSPPRPARPGMEVRPERRGSELATPPAALPSQAPSPAPSPVPSPAPADLRPLPAELPSGEALPPVVKSVPPAGRPAPRPDTAPAEGSARVAPEQRPERSRSGGTRSSPSPESGPGMGDTVYVTASGKKYHRAGCRYLRKSATSLSLDAARAKGTTPCSRCIR